MTRAAHERAKGALARTCLPNPRPGVRNAVEQDKELVEPGRAVLLLVLYDASLLVKLVREPGVVVAVATVLPDVLAQGLH